MGRYIGPVCRLCRREGVKLFLKGNKCLTKCTLENRSYPPGINPELKRVKKPTDYGLRLREKQKAKRIYNMTENQFKRFFEMAEKQAKRARGLVGEHLLQLLERRLDNVVYRLGFALSRRHARQLVRHRHVLVNGRIVDIPSYIVDVGDVIKITDKSMDIPEIQEAIEMTGSWSIPPWLLRDINNYEGRVLALPTRDQIDVPVNEQLIVEFYSR
ncbi:MAG: 30S ribosomal protein S4 [Armatimonadota bacterium]|nr:30S ribosomal protein S4 [Armatimonadota bacterium]MDW8024738.1 30S ribosomal protein S4 [Armatimonadota bacterium]